MFSSISRSMQCTFDLLHVKDPSLTAVLVRSAPKPVNSLLCFACAIMLMSKMICRCKMIVTEWKAENRTAEHWLRSGLNRKRDM